MSERLSRPWLWALLAFALLAGLGLRLYRFPLPGSQADPSAPLATLPPGLDSDEAYHTLAALQVWTGGPAEPFFKVDQGLPAAMIYLIALVFQFTGPVAEGGRLVSLGLGIALLGALPMAARQLFPDQRPAAVFTAGLTAFTFWSLNFSRIGLEQMTAAVLIALAWLAFWRWVATGGVARACLAGLTAGLALYTYPAAYALPAALALTGLYLAVWARPRWRPVGREALWLGAALALAAAPLMLFFVNNPEWMLRRSSQVAGGWALWPAAVFKTLGALAWQGDAITRHNVASAPLFDPVQLTWWGVGLAYAIRRWRERPFGLVLIWAGVLLLPAMLSADPAHFGRLAGSLPALLLLGGLGGGVCWAAVSGPRVRPALRWVGQTGLTLGLLWSAGHVAEAYFVRWPQSAGYLDTFDFPERVQAEAVLHAPNADAYLSPSPNNRSMFAFFWHNRPLARSFDGRACTVAPETAARETHWLINVLPGEDTFSAARLTALYPALDSELLFVPQGTPGVARFSVPPGAAIPLTPSLVGGFGDFVELRTVAFNQRPAAGATLQLRLTWRVKAATPADWTVGVYLLDAAQTVLAQDDRRPCNHTFLTPIWQPGELIIEDRTLALPLEIRAGAYSLEIALYQLAGGGRAPAYDANALPTGDRLRAGEVEVR